MNPNACRAAGRGLQPKGLRVKEVADFKVFTKGAGSGALNVSVRGPSESDSSLFSESLLLAHFGNYFPLFGLFVQSYNMALNKMHEVSKQIRIHFDGIIRPQLEQRSK